MATVAHKDSWMELEELGKKYPPYRPNYPEIDGYINDEHRYYSSCPTVNPADNSIIVSDIPGWLLRADALKLYEMAYCSPGDILELGSYHGLSTSIMAKAVEDSKEAKMIYTVDLQEKHTLEAKHHLEARGLADHVKIHCSDAGALCRELISQGKQFTFAFIDHCHEYEPTVEVCKIIDKLLPPGSFCLFHDFNNPKNADPDNKNVGVYQAIQDALPTEIFEFYGIYGCVALYRRG